MQSRYRKLDDYPYGVGLITVGNGPVALIKSYNKQAIFIIFAFFRDSTPKDLNRPF